MNFIIYCVVYIYLLLVQVSVTSSSGIPSVTLVESGLAGEGPDSGCPREREGEEDRCFKLLLSTQTVENNKVHFRRYCNCIVFKSQICVIYLYISTIICLVCLKRPPNFVFIITIIIQYQYNPDNWILSRKDQFTKESSIKGFDN